MMRISSRTILIFLRACKGWLNWNKIVNIFKTLRLWKNIFELIFLIFFKIIFNHANYFLFQKLILNIHPLFIEPHSEPQNIFLYHLFKSGIINLLIESKNIISLVRIIFWRSCASFSSSSSSMSVKIFLSIPQENYYTFDSLVVSSINSIFQALISVFSSFFFDYELFIRSLLTVSFLH